MVDYVINNENLAVFGGPASLNVSTDFGKTGARGSQIYQGNGNPSTVLTSSVDVQVGDLYINTNTLDPYYSWLYQYVQEVGSPVWKRTLKLNPQQFSQIQSVIFGGTVAGVGYFDIKVSDIVESQFVSGAGVEDFIVRYSIENSAGNPVSTSFVPTVFTPTGGVKTLRIAIKGLEYSSNAWSLLSGGHKVHMYVSYVAV